MSRYVILHSIKQQRRCIITRINVVPVDELTRQHLIAEIRELPRVFTLVKNAQAKGLNKWSLRKKQPAEYTLGTGHVLFLYDKLKFLADRYESLCNEWRSRGYNVNQVGRSDLLSGIRAEFINDYTPTENALHLNRERIQLRLSGVKH